MNILVISGFLGAGKTTFIKELVKRTKKDFCILENDFGSINIDKEFLENENPSLNVVELTQGCVCCSSKGDFENSISAILSTIDPDYLIIEPTGVGYLSSIINVINKIDDERLTLLSPITIIDAFYILNHFKDFNNEILIDQIKYSSKVIISKSEKLMEYEKKIIINYIRKINEKIEIIIDHYSSLDDSFFFNLLTNKNNIKNIDTNIKEMEYEEFSILDNISIKSKIELTSFLNDLIKGIYGDVIRSKGLIKLNEGYFNFNLVDNSYSIEEVENAIEIKEGIVIIGKALNKDKLRKRCSSLIGNKFIFKKQKLF